MIAEHTPALVRFAEHPNRAAAEALVEQARAAQTSTERMALAHQALSLWPDCARAYAVLGEQAEAHTLYRIGFCEAAVEAGKRALQVDPELGDQGIGVSPDGLYLLTLYERWFTEAYTFGRINGALHDAIRAGRDALSLDSGDPLGLRFRLVACLLEAPDTSYTHAALEYIARGLRTDPDHVAAWSYFQALAHFRLRGDGPRSRDALHRAILADAPLGAALRAGIRVHTLAVAEHLGPKATAALQEHVSVAHSAWEATPGALTWLELQCVEFFSEHHESLNVNVLTLLGVPDPREPRSPIEQAERLVWLAWDATHPEERARLLERALALTDECSGAYALAARQEPVATRKLELYTRALEVAERRLGDAVQPEPQAVNLDEPGWLDYVKALAGVAYLEWTLGNRAQAIAHYDRLAVLDPQERGGAHLALLTTCLLEEREPEGLELAQALCFHRAQGEQYRGEHGLWAYFNLALALILLEHPKDDLIVPILEAALEINPVVAVLLLGDWEMPPRLPWLYEQGEPTEAVDYVSFARSAWAMCPGALDILAEVSEALRRDLPAEPDWDEYDWAGIQPASVAEYIDPIWPGQWMYQHPGVPVI